MSARRRYSYVGSFLGFTTSHAVTQRRIGYRWFVIDLEQKEDKHPWLPYKVVQHCFTRREARIIARELNEQGFVSFRPESPDPRYTHGTRTPSQ